MLGVLPLYKDLWKDRQAENLDTYKLWIKELIKTVDDLELLYEKNGDFEQFKDDFLVASKTYKEYRISVIRNPKLKKHSPDEILGVVDPKYRGQWYQLFRDQDLAEEI